jgi:hypothetical protein
VHAARGASTPVTLPAAYFGRHLRGLAGTRDLVADGESLTLPSAGAGFDWWLLPGTGDRPGGSRRRPPGS